MGTLGLDPDKISQGGKWGFVPATKHSSLEAGGRGWEIRASEGALSGFKNEHQEWPNPEGPTFVKRTMDFWRLPPSPHNRVAHLRHSADNTRKIDGR